MKKLKVTRYSDGGHSWFKVPRKLIRQLEIESLISSFSYQLNDNVYLEEDCDVAIFFAALLKIERKDLTWKLMESVADISTKYSNKQSKIRSYPRFVPNFKRVEWVIGNQCTLYGKTYIMGISNDKKTLDDGFRKYGITDKQLDEIFPVTPLEKALL